MHPKIYVDRTTHDFCVRLDELDREEKEAAAIIRAVQKERAEIHDRLGRHYGCPDAKPAP